MMFSGRALRALPLMIAVFLTACGGGGDPASTPVVTAPGIQIGEPTPGAFATAAFVARARVENCSELRNKLYIIDNRMVLWDRAGNCPDNSNAQVLFGASVDTVLCSAGDSIAGPVVSCKDPADRPLFDTIRKNLDRADLGLAGSHSVAPVSFLPQDGTALAFDALFNSGMSAITAPKQVVVRDAAAFAELWKQHGAYMTPAPALPKVDFATHMVIGLFAGTSQGCHEIGLVRVVVGGDKLVAEYMERDITPVAMCIAAMTSPMQLSLVKRTEAAVEFRQVKP